MNSLLETKDTELTPPIALGPERAAKALDIGLTTLHRLTKEGKLPYFKDGKVVLYGVKMLEDWIKEKSRTATEKA